MNHRIRARERRRRRRSIAPAGSRCEARPSRTSPRRDVRPCARAGRLLESPARGDLCVVEKTVGVVRESGPDLGAGSGCQPHAAGSAVQIQGHPGTPRSRRADAAAAGFRPHPDCLRTRARNRSSTTTPILRSGRCALSSASAGVVSTQSPRERRRITAIREPDGSRSSK